MNRAPSWFYSTLFLGLLLLAGGCATPKRQAQREPIFYPPAPDEPRIQFLMGFSGESQLRGNADDFKRFVVGRAPPVRPIYKPYGLTVFSNQLFVCDTVRALEVIDLSKRQVRYFTPQGEGRLRTPINISIDTDGTRYVADTGRRQVVIFGPDDKYLGAIGELAPKVGGTGPHAAGSMAAETAAAEYWKPTDVAIGQDRLYVTDLKSHSVHVYNKSDRKALFTIPREDDANPTNKLYQPTNLAIDKQGRLYVSDTGGFRVLQFDKDGKFLRTFGAQGIVPGTFALPKGIALDRENRLYVVDAATQLVQLFDDQGRLLMYFGEPGESAAALNLPAKVAIDYEHAPLFQQYAAPGFALEYLVLVSNQYGDRKISIYGFGRKQK